VSTAVRGWQFQPARGSQPVESTVLVAAVFRPPAIYAPEPGKPPADTSTMVPDAPFPLTMVTPPYPPRAIDNRLVLIEVQVGTGGNVADAKVIGRTSGFDDAALNAAQRWTFRPAEVAGVRVSAFAYLMFGFRRPVTITSH
jgi:TonB family protein